MCKHVNKYHRNKAPRLPDMGSQPNSDKEGDSESEYAQKVLPANPAT